MAPARERNRIGRHEDAQELRGELRPGGGAGELGIQQLGERAGGEREDHDGRPDDHHDQAEQVRRQLVGAFALALRQQRREDGHERGADRGVGEQLLHELRDHRDRDEGVVRGIDAIDGGGDDLPPEPGEARDGRSGGDDDGREREPALVIAHESSDSTAGGEVLPGEAGGAAPGRPARPAPSLAEGGPASRPSRPYRRTPGPGVRAR